VRRVLPLSVVFDVFNASHRVQLVNASVCDRACEDVAWIEGWPVSSSARVGGVACIGVPEGESGALCSVSVCSSWQGVSSCAMGSGVARYDDLYRPAVRSFSKIASGTNGGPVLGNGDRLSLTLSHRDSDSDTRNARASRDTAYVQYAMAEPLGPVRLALTLGAAVVDYPDYAVGFIVVPGGRADETVFGSVDMVFDRFDYAGFVPSMTVGAQKTRSNVSRFSASEVAISFGIRSRF
jgi:hypothetical protein